MNVKRNLKFVWMIGIISFLGLVNPVLAHAGEDESMHYGGMMSGMSAMMYGSYGTSGMLFGWLVSVLVVVALVLLIMWLIKQIQMKK